NRTVGRDFNAVVSDAQVIDVEAILAASDTAFDGGAAGQLIVGCIYADLKIVAGAVDDEIEGADQRLDLAVGAKVDGSRDITSGDAGEGGDAVGLDLDGAIVSHFR